MDSKNKSTITRTGDYLIVPVAMTLEDINRYPHTPKILKKAIGILGEMSITLDEALRSEPYLMPIFLLADGMMEKSKGDWSIKVDYGVSVVGDIRIDLYGLESYFYEVREGKDGEAFILAGIATIQNANVPDWRVVFAKDGGVIFRDKKLEGLIQGHKIQDAKRNKKEVIAAYSDAIGEDGQEWILLLEIFLEKSGL